MQDFKLVGREIDLCVSSIKNFTDLETHLLIPIKQGSELYIQYFLNHISETLKSKTGPPTTKFYALFLLLRASQLQNYSFFYLLATKSDQLTNMIFHYSQVDYSSSIPANRKGMQIFSKTPSYQEGVIGINFLRLCQELVIYWYETTKTYKPRESFEIFQYIYSCTKKKCQLPKTFCFLDKVFDFQHEIAHCDFAIKSPYLGLQKESDFQMEAKNTGLSNLGTYEGTKAHSDDESESSLSMDEDLDLIMNPNNRSKHRTSTVHHAFSGFNREITSPVVANSQTEIGGSAPKENPMTAMLRRTLFQSRKNLSLPPESCQNSQENWGRAEIPTYLNDSDGANSVSSKGDGSGDSSRLGSPNIMKYLGLLKEDTINIRQDEMKTDDSSEVLSRGRRRKQSMEEDLQEIHDSINNSRKNSIAPSSAHSLTSINNSSRAFQKLFENEDAKGDERKSSFHDIVVPTSQSQSHSHSDENFASPKPALRKSKFSICVTSDQKSDGNREHIASVDSATLAHTPGKSYTMNKRQSNLEVKARVNSLFQDFKPEPRRSSCVTNIDRRFSSFNKHEEVVDNNETSLNLDAEDSSPKSNYCASPSPNMSQEEFNVAKTNYKPRLFFEKLSMGSYGEVRVEDNSISPSKSPKMQNNIKVYKTEEPSEDMNKGKVSFSGNVAGWSYVDENKALKEKLKQYEDKIKILEKQARGEH